MWPGRCGRCRSQPARIERGCDEEFVAGHAGHCITWWTFRTFFIFFLLERGEGGVRGAGGGGGQFFCVKIPGGGLPGGWGRGGSGREGVCGELGGEGLISFFRVEIPTKITRRRTQSEFQVINLFLCRDSLKDVVKFSEVAGVTNFKPHFHGGK